MPPHVFPGSTPYIESAAAELGVEVRSHEVQKIPAIRTVAVLAGQAGEHPRPAELVEAAAEHLATLDVAALAARAMVDDVAELAGPSAAQARADARGKAEADAQARARAVADLEADRDQLAAKVEAQAAYIHDLEARLKVAEGAASAVPTAVAEPGPKASEAPADPEAKAKPKK